MTATQTLSYTPEQLEIAVEFVTRIIESESVTGSPYSATGNSPTYLQQIHDDHWTAMLNVLEKLGLIESLPDDKRMTGFLLVNETDVVRVLPQDVTEGQISICFIWSDRGVSRSRQRLSLTGDGCLECPFCQRKATELLIFYYENYASCVTCSTALSEENRALYDAFLEREKASVK